MKKQTTLHHDIEVRMSADGKLDEVVMDGGFVHLEQMDDNHWWLGFTINGKTTHVNLMTAKAVIKARVEQDV